MRKMTMKSMKCGLVCIVIMCASSGISTAADDFKKISSSVISIQQFTDEAKAAVEAVENKEFVRIYVGKSCSQEDFAAICQLGWIRMLSVEYGNEKIHDLSPLVHLEDLQDFSVKSAKASEKKPFDVGPLAQLSKLVNVSFYATKITNTQAMSGLKKLRNVGLYMSAVDSIDFLDGTPEVETLVLYGNEHTFKDYKPLLSLKKLKILNIYMNPQASDELLAPLQALTSLQTIEMANCRKLTTLDFLKNCKDLKKIEAKWCDKLTDISALAHMTTLKTVDVSDCPIDMITLLALSNKKDLEELNVEDTGVSSLSFLKGCVSLKRLDLSGTQVKDLLPLSECGLLENLDISETLVKDLSPLAECEKLAYLNITDTQVNDVSVLGQCKGLVWLGVSDAMPQEQTDKLKEIFPKLRIQRTKKLAQ